MANKLSTTRLQRRLAGILSLDVVGYGRLIGSAEEATHARLIGLLDGFVATVVQSCGGRIFKKTGDGVLAEFSSIVQATLCAVMIQQGMREGRGSKSSTEVIQFRIGINLGEVIVESDDIYGEDVTIAVRLEGYANPGGICVSQVVADQVRGKLPVEFEDMGAQTLKNIDRSIRAFRVGVPQALLQPPAQDTPTQPRRRLIGFASRAAIAVLPFLNLSGDPNQEYFADGLTEDIIVGLAGWHALPVISRNSSFAFKKPRGAARAIGAKLGALYVLEGTVRRSASRVRIGVQLIETRSGEHIFAEHYDRTLGEIFAVQDTIARSIVGEVAPELLRFERERVARTPQLNLDAYECYQRGLWHHYRYSKEDAERAEECFRRALALDANYAPAAAALATSIVHSSMSDWVDAERYREAEDLAARAVALDPRDPQAHFALGIARYHLAQIEPALKDLKQAIRLNPSHAAAHANMGFLFNYLDRPAKALRSVQAAFRLSPVDPRQFLWYTALSGAHYLKGNYEDAIGTGQRGLGIRPDYLHTVRYVVASLGQLGRLSKAQEYIPSLKSLDSSLDGTKATLGRVFRLSALNRILDGLRQAGFE